MYDCDDQCLQAFVNFWISVTDARYDLRKSGIPLQQGLADLSHILSYQRYLKNGGVSDCSGHCL